MKMEFYDRDLWRRDKMKVYSGPQFLDNHLRW
jgi:hypothetical protein